MKFILSEQKKFVLEEKYILLEKNRRTEARSHEEGQKLLQTYLSKQICKVFGNGKYEVVNIEAAGVPTIGDKDLNPDLKRLLNNDKDGWLKADNDKLERWAELTAKRLKAENKFIVDSSTKKIRIKTEENEEKNNSKLDNDVEIATEWAELYKLCGKATDKQKAFSAFWNGGLPLKNEENPENLPIAANDKFKKGYYAGEWGEHSKLIRSFGSHFTKLLSEYGWTTILNPFISFLKDFLFKDPKNIQKITINDASFAHIVEAFNSKLISKNDLRGKGILEKFNLIFNPILYTDSTSMIEYLKGQLTAIKRVSVLPEGSDLKTTFMNIAAKDGNNSNLNDSKILDTIKANSYNYIIRPLTTYKELIKVTFDPNDEEDETVKDASNNKINSIINSINTQDKAKKFLAYLISVCRIMNVNLANELNKKFNNKLIANRNATQTTFEEEVAFDKLLNRSTTKYSAAQLETIITEVIKIAKI